MINIHYEVKCTVHVALMTVCSFITVQSNFVGTRLRTTGVSTRAGNWQNVPSSMSSKMHLNLLPTFSEISNILVEVELPLASSYDQQLWPPAKKHTENPAEPLPATHFLSKYRSKTKKSLTSMVSPQKNWLEQQEQLSQNPLKRKE